MMNASSGLAHGAGSIVVHGDVHAALICQCMSLLFPLPLDHVSLPVLIDNEFIICSVGSIKCKYNGERWPVQNSLVSMSVTPLRILLTSPAASAFVPISSIESIQPDSSWVSMFSSPQLSIKIQHENPATVVFTFHKSDDYDSVLKSLTQSMQGCAWKADALCTGRAAPSTSVPSSAVGIGSIIRDVQQKQSLQNRTLDSAFSDLRQLMHQAQDMVDLSKRISASLSSSVSSNDNNDSREFSAMLAEFGLMSSDAVLSDSQFSAPVNCSSFIEALAKQVESIIARPMTNRGGHLALTDVYCLVNRVRGTDFVSPDDLIKACRLGKSFHVAKLPSGLLVLRQNELADTSVMAQRIVSCISECSAGKSRGISALELSASMRLSVPLSEEVLLMAESNGVLCRDESDQDGIRFWINIFV